MTDETGRSVLALARQRFLSGVIFAAIPIGIQVATAGLIATDPSAWPNADKSFERVAFWFMQVILLCVSVSGNTLVDLSMSPSNTTVSKVWIHGLYFWIVMVSLSVATSMLDSYINYKWILYVCLCAVATLGVAYKIQLQMALSDIGPAGAKR